MITVYPMPITRTEIRAEVLRLWIAGWSRMDIATHLLLPYSVVYRITRSSTM